MEPYTQTICRKLKIDDVRFVEIESKKRILAEQAEDLTDYLSKRKAAEHVKSSFFLDQYLDTPDMRLFKIGASLRLRYKRNATTVYLQYKGPGFIEDGLLYRSEFSSAKLRHVVLEESHHDVIRFPKTSLRDIFQQHLPPKMIQAMRLHLGRNVVSRINTGPILCVYQKEKFAIDLGSAFLEPSVDRIIAFHVNSHGLHTLSTFWEYENEIKAPKESLAAKLAHLPELLEFDARLSRKFGLKAEPMDKYHRCASIFFKRKRG